MEEVRLRTKELRSSLDRSSSLRRILYLSSALYRIIEPHPRSVFPETWEILDGIPKKFNQVDMAKAIFDAEEVDDERFEWSSPISGEPDTRRHTRPDFLRR
jgi:hypothetical protein